MTDRDFIDAVAQALCDNDPHFDWLGTCEDIKNNFRGDAQAALTAIFEAGFAIVRDDDLRMANGALDGIGLAKIPANSAGLHD